MTEVTPPLPAPVLNLPPPTKFERELAAFERLKPQLLERYRGLYVAIHEEAVVASGPDIVAVALEAYKTCGYCSIYVDLVTDQPPRVVRIPHYQIVSRG